MLKKPSPSPHVPGFRSKTFDKIRPAALRSALVRLAVPQHMVEIVCELEANP